MRLWNSPQLFLSFSGDEQAARALVRQARIYAGYLFDQLQGRQKFRMQTWVNADGSTIQVMVWDDLLGRRASAKIAVPVARGLETTVETVGLFIESGFLSWGLAPTFPLTVYTDTALQAYLAGPGTPIPAGGEPDGPVEEVPAPLDQYLFGLARSRPCQSGSLYFLFPTRKPAEPDPEVPAYPPLLEPDGHYDSHVYVNEPPRGAAKPWTGEGKRLDQALLAAGRGWADILPTGWYGADPNDPGEPWSMGAIRDPSGGWWVYWIEPNGLLVAPLLLPPVFACTGETALDGLAEDLVAAFRLGYSAMGQIGYALLEASDLEPVYADGAKPLYHGWHGLYQTDAGDPAGLVMTATRLGEASNTYFSRTAAIGLTWSEGVPTATISVSGESEWGGGGARVRVPNSNATAELLPAGTDVLGSEATVYSFTTPGGVARVRCVAKTGASSESFSEPWPTIVGSGSQTARNGTESRSGTCGWKVEGAVSRQAQIDPITAKAMSENTVAVTEAGSWSLQVDWHDLAFGTGLDFHSGAAEFICHNPNYQTILDIEMVKGHYTTSTKEFVSAAGFGQAMLCLLYDDPGVVVATAQSWTSGTAGESSRASLASENVGCRGSCNEFSMSVSHVPWGSPNQCYVTDGGSGLVPDARVYIGGGYLFPPGVSSYQPLVSEQEVSLVASSGLVADLSDGWPNIPGLSRYTNIPFVMASFGGKTVYSQSPGEMVGPAGVPDAVLNNRNVRFIGAM